MADCYTHALIEDFGIKGRSQEKKIDSAGVFDRAMEVILDEKQIQRTLDKLVDDVTSGHDDAERIAVIGIRSRGEILAQRLVAALGERLGREILSGVLDITLYRDDLNDPHGDKQPTVRSTEISFDISDCIIILVDDVLHTGRSVRAAMDALFDLGRPRAIRLAVLIDRGHHELPIQADFSGVKVDIAENKSVAVQLIETDGTDQVVVE